MAESDSREQRVSALVRQIDLAERDPDGEFGRSVRRSIDPVDVGVEMLSLLASGRLDVSPPASGRLDVSPPADAGPGLVHEPARGEALPAGFVLEHD